MKPRGKEGRHFTLEGWAEFARKVVPKVKMKAMKQHLENCKKCREAAQMMTRISEVAKRPGLAEPPDSAVRSVRGMFAIHGPKKPTSARSLVAKLLFDSFLSPLQAGVRSSAADSRQLLYGTGDYRVDLRFEPQIDSDKVLLTGQVLNSADPAQGLDSAPVILLHGRKVFAESRTNQLGEFHLECLLDSQLELRIKLPGSAEVSIPLVQPFRKDLPPNLEMLGLSEVKDGLQARKSTRKKG
jgi:hypothetical protein